MSHPTPPPRLLSPYLRSPQATYYFGYMFLACLGAFFMLGAVGFLASFVFVRRIYKNLKLD